MSALGDDGVARYPPLAVVAVLIAALTGNTSDAERWAAFVESVSFDQSKLDGSVSFDQSPLDGSVSFDQSPLDGSVSFESGRAMVRALLCANGPDRMRSDASRALELEPVWSPWRKLAVCLAGEANLLVGDLERATELFVECLEPSARSAGAPSVAVSHAELALLALDREDTSVASDHAERAMTLIDENHTHDYSASVLVFVAAAHCDFRRGDVDAMNRHLTAAMRARVSLTYVQPFLAVRVRFRLAQLHWAIGDRPAAHHLLREIDELLVRRPALGALIDEVASFRAAISSSDHPTTIADMPAGGPPLTPAELRLLPYLQTHLTMAEIAGRLFVSRNTINSQVSSIYRKLAVSSRAGAVEQATVLGLLGG